ncbi:MAG: GyrI-like domain-containing protein, partial [Anaerolineaceae bacterium]
EIKDQPAMSVLAVRTRCAVAELPRVLGETYAKIEAYLVEVGGQPVYAPFVVYYTMDMDALDIDAGIPVAGGVSGTGEIQAHEWPGGRVLSSVYTGAYEGMPEAYAQIDAWADAHGVRRQGIVYEFYHNDPAITPPGQLVTEIVFPLA